MVGFSINFVREQPVLTPIYHGKDNERKIALTINVYWGNEYLLKMLEIMEENDVKATFFVGGQWAKKNPEILKKDC